MMANVLQADDTNEYFHDTDYELLGNGQTYGVIWGCAVTYDATDMTLDVAAGGVLVNGAYVTVAAQANALTLVADGSNKRWSYVTINSSGTAVLTSGDAAASSSVEPTKPERPDGALLAMVKIEAAQTVANDIAVKLDKRFFVHVPEWRLVGYDGTERTTTSATDNTALSTITIPATPAAVPIKVTGVVRKTSGAAANAAIGLMLNATQVFSENATAAGVFSATDQAETGVFEFLIPPRVTGYLRTAQLHARTSESGSSTPETLLTETNWVANADAPTADISTVVVSGDTTSASITLAVDEVKVYVGGVGAFV